MSNGLKLIHSIIKENDIQALKSVDEVFYEGEEEVEVVKYVKEHYHYYKRLPDLITIQNETGVKIPKSIEPTEFYVRKVNERKFFNDTRELFGQLRTGLVDRDRLQCQEVIKGLSSYYRGVIDKGDLMPMSDLITQCREASYRNKTNTGLIGVTSGWPQVDSLTNGYEPGDLSVWVARPAQGKTYYLVEQCRRAWMSGKVVLFVSMEMTLQQITNRFLGCHTGINTNYIRKYKTDYWADLRIKRAQSELTRKNRFFLLAGNFNKTTDNIDRAIEEVKPDIVYIDGLYLMEAMKTSSWAQRPERMSVLLNEVKTLAITDNIPIVATTQFGRSAGSSGKDGSLETIGYTDAISTHSTIIFGIKPCINESLNIKNYRDVDMLKNREEECKPFRLNYRFTPMDFSFESFISDEEIQASQDGNSSGGNRGRPGRTRTEVNLNHMR